MSPNKAFLVTLLALAVSGSVLVSRDLQKCQREYDQLIGELIGSTGMSATNAVWKILFNSLDLNDNEKVSASEIVLKLDTKELVPNGNTGDLLPQVQSWINSAVTQDGDKELNFKEFVDVVEESIGKIDKTTSIRNRNVDATTGLCTYFLQRIPKIIQSIQDLSNCTSSLKRDLLKMLESSSKRQVLNTWKAEFSTLDSSCNNLVSIAELSEAYLQFSPNSNDSKEDVERKIKSFLTANNLNQSNFIRSISAVLFGTPDNKVWLNISSNEEIEGKQLFCDVLRNTRCDVIERLEESSGCKIAYNKTVTRVLNKNSAVAAPFIFAIADRNKDGLVTASDLENFVNSSSFPPSILWKGNDDISLSLENFTAVMPNRVVSVNEDKNDVASELSLFSSQQQQAWNALCLAAIQAINAFPTSIGGHKENKEQPPSPTSTSGSLAAADPEIATEDSSDWLVFLDTDASTTQIPISSESTATTEEESTPATTVATAKETTQAERVETTPSPAVATGTTSPISEGGFPKLVLDVISELEKHNSSDAENRDEVNIEKLLKELQVSTNKEQLDANEQKSKNEKQEPKKDENETDEEKDRGVTKEEQELYDLLVDYKKDLQNERILPSAGASSSQTRASHKRPSTSAEEQELQRVLESAVNDMMK